jgi:hypothetical protein
MSRVATVVETRVPPGLLPDFVRAYSLGIAHLPPELNQTFLIRSEADPTVVRIHQYWLKVATMEQVASPFYRRPVELAPLIRELDGHQHPDLVLVVV